MSEKVNPHNAGIYTLFMNNLDMNTVNKHHEVVEKFNKSKVPHYSIQTDLKHGAFMDIIWKTNGIDHPTFAGQDIPKNWNHDVIMFLDVDAIPLNDIALDYYIQKAVDGLLIGNAQRSNHIQNDQHLFAAPSAVACSVDTFLTMGKPSGIETRRADVGEEYTFAAEKVGVGIELIMPLRFDAPPAECPSWALKDGMPVYGRGTTFGLPCMSEWMQGNSIPIWEIKPDSVRQDMIWHNFQSFHEGQQQRFMQKCEEVLKT